MNGENRIHTEILVLRALLMISLGIVIFLNYQLSKKPVVLPPSSTVSLTANNELPHYNQIMAILKPLEYSGVEDMMKPDVNLKIDFPSKTWALTNLHKYDKEGHIQLDHNRYGLCGELAAYVYRKISFFMQDHFDILFLKTAESGFFLRPKSTHIVLLLTDKKTQKRFFIDPSFRRYGKEEDFSDYLFFEAATVNTHLKSLTPDVAFPADSETPLLIRNDFLICLGTEAVNDKFDKNNFVIALTANKRHEYSGRYVFALRKTNGVTEEFRNEPLLSQLLSDDEIKRILSRLTEWFQTASR